MRVEEPAGLQRRPTVTVVIPCYKYGHFLPDAVASAFDQDDVDVNVLIVDDASPDDSADVARRLAEQDPRVKVLVHETNQGHIRTYNDGLELATGDYTVLLSADDLLTRNALTRAAALLDAHPSVGLAYGPILTFETMPAGALTGPPSHWVIWPGLEWATALFANGRNALYSPEAVVRTSTMREVGLYDPEHPHAGDLQMWLRIAAASDVGFLSGVTQAYYRQHLQNMHSSVFATDQGAGMITELRHRLAAFAAAARQFDHGDALLQRARSAEAVEAIDLASRAYVWGLTKAWPVADLVAFAHECDPGIDDTPAGRVHAWIRRLGPRLSFKNPALVVRERLLDRQWENQLEQKRQVGAVAVPGPLRSLRTPRVSVVIPCYNYAQYLSECLASVLGQTGVELDVTIVDDRSSDGSLELAHEWARSDSRVSVVEHPQNRGHIATFNEALAAGLAPYVVKMDPDDLLTAGALRRGAEALDRHPDAAFVYGRVIQFVGEPPTLGPQRTRSLTVWDGPEWAMRRARFGHNIISQPEVMIRRAALQAVGGHDARVPEASDLNLWLRLASWGRVVRLNDPVQGLYRIHPNSMQRAIYTGRLTDLRARIKAFDLYLGAVEDSRIPSDAIRARFRRTLADDALRLALESYDEGRQDEEPIDEYTRIALELDPTVVERPRWRELSTLRTGQSSGVAGSIRRVQRRLYWDRRVQWLRR